MAFNQDLAKSHPFADRGLIRFSFKESNLAEHRYYGDINMITADSFSKLNSISDMLQVALKLENYGDIFFLYNYINFNGHNDYINIGTGARFEEELNLYLKLEGSEKLELLADTTSYNWLSDYFKNFSYENSLTKRDSTACDGSHVPSVDSCDSLADDLYSKGTDYIFGSDSKVRSYCKGGCCISWNKLYTPANDFSGEYAYGKVHWCIDQCISKSQSCEIHELILSNNAVADNFCVSNRATGCGGTENDIFGN